MCWEHGCAQQGLELGAPEGFAAFAALALLHGLGENLEP